MNQNSAKDGTHDTRTPHSHQRCRHVRALLAGGAAAGGARMSDVIDLMRAAKNKAMAQLALKILRKKNPNAKLAEAYEKLSRYAKHRDWNTANAAGVDFEDVIKQFIVEQSL